MAKQANQKLKLLYLMDFLLQNSDEEHLLTVADMIAHLAANGISAERKSIYSDIEALMQYGLDIVQVRGAKNGYYVASREFQVAELKLLVDSVQSSKFITQKKTMELIKKIEKLASSYDAQQLQRQVYVHNRIKAMNESIYINVDAISEAIARNKQLSFQYFKYTVEQKDLFANNAKEYTVTPVSLVWNNQNYYLVALDEAVGILKHFRVDKMKRIVTTEIPASASPLLNNFDIAEYTRQAFDMFAGELTHVHLRFSKELAGVVLDRFGKDVMMLSEDASHFNVHVKVAVSNQFLGWIFGLGGQAEILGPAEVREQMHDLLKTMKEQYAK